MKLFDPPQLTGKYLGEVLASKWLTTGPMCERFREALSEFFQRPKEHVVLASSATAGFQAVLDELHAFGARGVAITEATWPGMRAAVKHAGMTFEERNVAEVHVYTQLGGAAYEDVIGPSWRDLTYDRPGRFRKPFVVQDACHSWLPDEMADFAVMSLYPTKLVAGAEGGVVLAPSEWAGAIKRRLNCGLAPAFGADSSRILTPTIAGRKGNMTDVQAALNLEALELAPAYMGALSSAWHELAFAASDHDMAFVAQPKRPYLFQVHTGRSAVRAVRKALEERGIPTAWNFPPLGRVTLPCWPSMTREDARKIVSATFEVLEEIEGAVHTEEI